jgi:hypothetical protein
MTGPAMIGVRFVLLEPGTILRDSGALQSADRSWWASTYEEWAYPLGLGRHAAIRTQPAARDLYAPVVAHACGSKILDYSLVVVVGPSEYSAEASNFFFIDRDGHPLVYCQNA